MNENAYEKLVIIRQQKQIQTSLVVVVACF